MQSTVYIKKYNDNTVPHILQIEGVGVSLYFKFKTIWSEQLTSHLIRTQQKTPTVFPEPQLIKNNGTAYCAIPLSSLCIVQHHTLLIDLHKLLAEFSPGGEYGPGVLLVYQQVSYSMPSDLHKPERNINL
jgi:hypothetical protein